MSAGSTPIPRLQAPITRATNTLYQAATDGFVLGTTGQGGIEINGWTDDTDATTFAARDYGSTGGSFSMFIKKDHYWKVDITGTNAVIFWIALK